MKSSGIGGQAVLEGVMMKNRDEYAVAVRKPNNEIEIKKDTFESVSKKYGFLRWPILRGIVAFVESMVLGMKTLTYSAGFYEEEEEEEKPSKFEKGMNKVFKGKGEDILMGLTVIFTIIVAVAIFMILPFVISELFKKFMDNHVVLALIEGAIRILLFMGYVLAISQMKDIKRVFMYHGAEHKSINCIEHGYELTVENVKKQSKQHKRCGTSFMLIVMFVSIIFFIFIRVDSPILRILVRLLLIPVIAGVSYEFIKLAGNTENIIINILSKPGLWLQGLTTREPDDEMIEVAIASVESVFDCNKYLEENKKIKLKELAAKNARKRESSEKRENTNVNKEISEEIQEEDEVLRSLDRYLDSKAKKETKKVEETEEKVEVEEKEDKSLNNNEQRSSNKSNNNRKRNNNSKNKKNKNKK